jgi:hypothetical protein
MSDEYNLEAIEAAIELLFDKGERKAAAQLSSVHKDLVWRMQTLKDERQTAEQDAEAADRRALAALDFANAAIECIPDGTPIKLLGEAALALLKEVDR